MSTIDTSTFLNTNQRVRSSGFSDLSAEEFSRVIFAELSKQDPLQPNDTGKLIEQISGLREMQSNMDLSSRLGELVNQNEFASAATLIGKRISGLDDNNQRLDGLVVSLGKTSEGARLTLADGKTLLLSRMDQIRESAEASDSPSTRAQEPAPRSTDFGGNTP